MTRPAVVEDALSELLNTIRLRGKDVFRTSADPGDVVAQPTGALLHIVEEGTARMLGEFPDLPVGRGDLVLLPRGQDHRVVAEESFRWLTGTIEYDASAAAERLLASLPGVVLLRFAEDDPREWLDVSVRLLLQEVVDPLPGALVMVSRIVDLLFVQTLRVWAREEPSGPGWLTAAMDPHLGGVIAALHREPDRPWTVRDMATVANLSRSSFAQRFAEAVGITPMQYLTDRRFDRAAELLAGTTTPVRRIAVLCGYTSEAAFSRAFRRRYGASPLHWRRGNGPT